MQDALSYASLSPELLARKGSAKPAMRSQAGALGALWSDPDAAEGATDPEDLGWNDMGWSEPGAPRRPLLHLVPGNDDTPVARTKRSRGGQAGHAALTLRIDPDRHLKLRLACTMKDMSAHTLLTEALDTLLDRYPGLNQLAAQLREQR
jgi:hypothetical protein